LKTNLFDYDVLAIEIIGAND